jgi:hypothetical protein
VKLAADGKITVPSAALATAANEVLKAVPEAVKHLNLSPEEIAKRVVDYIPTVPDTAAKLDGTVVAAPPA